MGEKFLLFFEGSSAALLVRIPNPILTRMKGATRIGYLVVFIIYAETSLLSPLALAVASVESFVALPDC